MSQEKFNLVFRGEIVEGKDLVKVKQNLMQLFKIDAQKVEALFSGKPVVLKKNLERDVAQKYKKTLTRAGAQVYAIALKTEKNSAASSTGSVVSAEKIPGQQVQRSTPAPSMPSANQDKEKEDWSLAPVGSDVLKSDEKRQYTEANIDVSALSVRENSGNLLDSDERQPEATPMQLRELARVDLAPVGDSLLRPNERQKQNIANIDIPELAVAEVGARMSEEKAPPKPPELKMNLSLE